MNLSEICFRSAPTDVSTSHTGGHNLCTEAIDSQFHSPLTDLVHKSVNSQCVHINTEIQFGLTRFPHNIYCTLTVYINAKDTSSIRPYVRTHTYVCICICCMYVRMYTYITYVCRYWCRYITIFCNYTYIDMNALAQRIKSFLPHVWFQAVAGAWTYGTDSPAITTSHANHSATKTSLKRMFNKPMIYVVFTCRLWKISWSTGVVLLSV